MIRSSFRGVTCRLPGNGVCGGFCFQIYRISLSPRIFTCGFHDSFACTSLRIFTCSFRNSFACICIRSVSRRLPGSGLGGFDGCDGSSCCGFSCSLRGCGYCGFPCSLGGGFSCSLCNGFCSDAGRGFHS